MVLLPADYLRQKFIEPLKERQKQEGKDEGMKIGLSQGRTQGIAQGRAQGRAQMRAEIQAWLRDKEQCERDGKEFNEPMPGAEENGSGNLNDSSN